MADPKSSRGYRLENLTRARIILPRDLSANPDWLVIGDKADTDDVVAGPERDPKYQPDPSVSLSQAEWDALPKTPTRDVLEEHIREKRIRRTAIELSP